MSLILAHRYAGASGSASLTPTDRAVELVGFKISGLGNAMAIPVCMYAYDATTKIWKPYTQ